jgi:anti-sigma B factor antagonist
MVSRARPENLICELTLGPMKAGLTITKSIAESVPILHLHGYLDGHTFIELERVLDATITAGVHRLVMDLGELTYIASAGVGVFINGQHQMRKLGGDLQLVNPTAAVREVFGILGLEALFTLHPTIEQGVAAALK